VGILLRGLKRADVERGQVICKPGSFGCHDRFNAEIITLTKAEGVCARLLLSCETIVLMWALKG
jgi:translation elongation factor EF-Tu-like GTPase